jgi:hypothetical protein
VGTVTALRRTASLAAVAAYAALMVGALDHLIGRVT